MVHGDDFVAVGHEGDLASTRGTLESKYKIKVETLGEGGQCKKEVRILNRIVRWGEDGVEMEADPRHAEIVVRDLGLSDAKCSRVPGTKEVRKKNDGNGKEERMTDIQVLEEEAGAGSEELILEADEEGTLNDSEKEEELGPADARRYRAITARLNYVSADRPDIQFAVKEAARAMSTPMKRHWAVLGKIGRYLRGRPRLVLRFPWQVSQSMATTYTDSDWAGCVKTARSTSGGIVTIGDHMIKSYSRQQKVVALSSAEAELYAMVAASAETLAVIAYAKDLGIGLTGEIYTDSSAALGISQRAGIGKVRHLRTQALWVQETRVTGRLSYKKVLGSKNPADILTKHVPGELLDRHLETLGAEVAEGRAEAAPELSSLESLVQWVQEPRKVHFAAKVEFRAIPQENRGRRCADRTVGRAIRRGGQGGARQGRYRRWADIIDDELETAEEIFRRS